MIKSFRHKGLAAYFAAGDRAGLPQPMVGRIAHRLAVLNAATDLRQIGLPGYRLHPLKGDQQGRWSISVTAAWRPTFRWERGDVLDLDLEQYH
jgi:proteic killer suppression protein